MALFGEIAFSYPVVHTIRENGVTVIAIRVPLYDVRLDKWGWILRLSNIDEQVARAEIETFNNSTGGQYPKIHLLVEVQNYIEKWHCYDWKEGYQKQPSKARITVPLNPDMVKEDTLRDIITELRLHQNLQKIELREELKIQAGIIVDTVKEKSQLKDDLITQTVEVYEDLSQKILTNHEDMKVMAETLRGDTSSQSLQIQEKIVESIDIQFSKIDQGTVGHLELQTQVLHEEIRQMLEKADAQVITQIITVQENTRQLLENVQSQITSQATMDQANIKQQLINIHDHIDHQPEVILETTKQEIEALKGQLALQATFLQDNTRIVFETQTHSIREDIKTWLSTIEGQIQSSIQPSLEKLKSVQEQLTKILDAVEPLPDSISDTKDTDDITDEATKLAKRPATHVEKIVLRQIGLGSGYYKTVKEQSERSFKLASRITIAGGATFFISVIILILAQVFLHLNSGTAFLLNGTTGILSALTTAVGAFNLFHDKSAKQFERFHIFLDRIMRSSIAHAMSSDVGSVTEKQQLIKEIVEELIENDETDKDGHKHEDTDKAK